MTNKLHYMKKTSKIILIILIGFIINYIIYLKGGAYTALSNLNLIPIIIVGFYWGIPQATLTAILLGVLVGPFMPSNVRENIMQTPSNWITRIVLYSFLAIIIGYIAQKNKKLNSKIIEKDSINIFTGLYNQNKLFPLLDKMVSNNEEFSLIIIRINNINQIEKYVNQDLITEINTNIIKKMKYIFEDRDLYDIHSNEFAIVFDGSDEDLERKVELLIQKNFTSLRVDKYLFSLIVKVGVYKIEKDENNVINFYNKARETADQGKINESKVFYYDSNLFYSNKINFNIASTLLDSLKNEEFYLVYQPIISLKNKTVVGSEVLTRWNRGDSCKVGPQQFIDIAENIGCISDFSIWIINESIKQINKWKEDNIILRTSINITTKELLDVNLSKIISKKISENDIDCSSISIEITERVLNEKSDELKDKLTQLREKGYKVSIDDFGTGYNSLKFIGEIPFDVVKIDKYFVDHICEYEVNALVVNMIKAVHDMGKVVVAEGIESEMQANMLANMGCDLAQGYFFSKPLLPNDFKNYYLKHNITS